MDQWQWWRTALAGDMGPIHDGEPQSGFYRARIDKNGPLVPVAIWQDEVGVFLCRVGYDDLWIMRDAAEMWTWCADRPVSHEAYQIAARTHSWPEPEDNATKASQMVTNVLTYATTNAEFDGLLFAIEELRTIDKAPHLEAGRIVDRKYKILKDRIDAARPRIRKAELETA